MRILLIEDEVRMAEALAGLLRNEGFSVDLCNNGAEGLEVAHEQDFDLILLDLMLPEISGLEIAKSLRARGKTTAIIMLTAKSELEDKVEGLDCGADDYLTKPFEIKELMARIRVIKRRLSNSNEEVLSFGDIQLNASTGLLSSSINAQKVQLSKKELQLMSFFLSHQNQVVTREQLALAIWGYDCDSEYNNVEVYLSFTRKKLSFLGSNVEIKAIRGIGYELRFAYV